MGTLLYYGSAVDPTLTIDLSAITSIQSKGTQELLKACNQLLEYVTTHPNGAIHYHASDMIILLDTYDLYLSKPEGKRRAEEYYYLTKEKYPKFHNDTILVLSGTIKHVMY